MRLYRDGSKLSQPLSNKSDKKKKSEDSQAVSSRQSANRWTVISQHRIEHC